MRKLKQLKAAQKQIRVLLKAKDLPIEVADAFGAANRAIATCFQQLQRQQMIGESKNELRD